MASTPSQSAEGRYQRCQLNFSNAVRSRAKNCRFTLEILRSSR